MDGCTRRRRWWCAGPTSSYMYRSYATQVTGIQNMGRTATVVVRGSNKLVLEEADRSLHDALCVVRCLVQRPFLIAGGGAPEIELSRQLREWAKSLPGLEQYCVKAFAEAMEVRRRVRARG
eukprot:978390-Prorocentrum_minimum.AAC.1